MSGFKIQIKHIYVSSINLNADEFPHVVDKRIFTSASACAFFISGGKSESIVTSDRLHVCYSKHITIIYSIVRINNWIATLLAMSLALACNIWVIIAQVFTQLLHIRCNKCKPQCPSRGLLHLHNLHTTTNRSMPTQAQKQGHTHSFKPTPMCAYPRALRPSYTLSAHRHANTNTHTYTHKHT